MGKFRYLDHIRTLIFEEKFDQASGFFSKITEQRDQGELDHGLMTETEYHKARDIIADVLIYRFTDKFGEEELRRIMKRLN